MLAAAHACAHEQQRTPQPDLAVDSCLGLLIASLKTVAQNTMPVESAAGGSSGSQRARSPASRCGFAIVRDGPSPAGCWARPNGSSTNAQPALAPEREMKSRRSFFPRRAINARAARGWPARATSSAARTRSVLGVTDNSAAVGGGHTPGAVTKSMSSSTRPINAGSRSFQSRTLERMRCQARAMSA